MDIVICGAGEVGRHAAEVLAEAANNITVIEADPNRLRTLEDALDIRALTANCASAKALAEANAGSADLVLATTNSDEVNLLTAMIAKKLGAKKCIARVHHRAYFDDRAFNYQEQLGIDRLICPEYSTAQAIARTLRNPAAIAIENFARGRIEMQEFPVSDKASAIGRRLADVNLPSGTRLAGVRRKDDAFIPEASSVIVGGDSVILVGNADHFRDARKLFQDEKPQRRRIVIMGGTSMAVWLCRLLNNRNFSIRLFETDRQRAEELAEKLDWVTVIQADPTERAVFTEEHLHQVDVFIAVLDDDEDNIIGAVLAKMRGVAEVITVVQRAHYLDVIYDIGVDMVFSPRLVAAEEINAELDESPMRLLGTLAEGVIDVFRVRIGDKAPVIGKPLREIKRSSDWILAAIQRGQDAHVPGADDVIEPGDVALVVVKHGQETELKKIFAAK